MLLDSPRRALGSGDPELPPLDPPLPTWFPPNIDDAVPPVVSGTSCPLSHALDGAAKRVKEFTTVVDRFTATEVLDHQSVNEWGIPTHEEHRRFSYVVTISEMHPGSLSVEEYRDGTRDLERFPDGIATLGLPALVLAFHPYYRDDFEMTCEGLGTWKGGRAWQIRFQQRPDRESRMRVYKGGQAGSRIPVALKGRAWIAQDSFQIVRLEADIVVPIPQINLVTEHEDIEFGPVKFRNSKEAFWLPKSADTYLSLRGHRFRRQHSYRDYLLYSVTDSQVISPPKQPAASKDFDPAGGVAKP